MDRPDDPSRPILRHLSKVFAALGVLSGLIAVLAVHLGQDSLVATPFSWLEVSPASLAPGIVFGAIFGLVLARKRLASSVQAGAYWLASTLSYFLAFTLARSVFFAALDENVMLTGIFAGAAGSFALACSTAGLFVFARRAWAIGIMVGAGTLLGALLPLAIFNEHIAYTAAFFALWQGGFALAFSSCVPEEG